MRRGLLGAVVALLMIAPPASAQGGRLAFDFDGEIWTMNVDGSDRQQLTRTPADSESSGADWSPDGTQVAFARGDEYSSVWLRNTDGTERRLTRPRRRTSYGLPDWRSNGEAIAVLRFTIGRKDLTSALVAIDVRTGRERVLKRLKVVRMLAFLSEPQWSPDGQRLLYTRTAVRAGTFEPSLYVLDVATGKSTKLAGASGSGAWSPDGQRIAFSSVRDRNGRTCGDDCTLHGELYVMNADGTGQTRLTRQKGDDAQPTWAPDGSAIAFSSARNDPDGGGDEVYVIRPDGSCLTWLTNGARDSTDPDWRPGSGALPEGFACGAVPREPTLLRAPRGPGLWLGLTGLRNTLLNEADDGFLSYGDCAVFDPAECGEPIDVQTGSICRGNPLVGGAEVAGTYEIRRGALVERGSDTTVYAGSTYTQIYAARDVDTVIDALRPLPSTEPVPSLEAPRFSARVVARIERARRLGTVRRIAHRLHVSGARARQLLALARATEPFRPLQTTNC